MERVIGYLVVILCLAVPVWFAASKAPYQSLSSRLRSPAVIFTGLVGTVLLIGSARYGVLGFAMVVPVAQLLILIGIARIFEAAEGEPLEHVPIQSFDFVGKFRHAAADLVASFLAATLPLYLLYWFFLRE
jgi:hypothetical protein